MKTMDERSVLASVLAVPVPVLVLDEEEAIEDLAATICAFLRSRYRQPCHSSAGRTYFFLPQLRTIACCGRRFLPEVRDPAWHRRCDATARGSVGERSCRLAGKS